MPMVRITMRQLFECMFWLCVGFAGIALMRVPHPHTERQDFFGVLGAIGCGPAFGAAAGAIFRHQFAFALLGIAIELITFGFLSR